MSGVPIIETVEPVGDFEFAKMTDDQKQIKRMEEQASQTFRSGVRQFIQRSELNNLKKMSNKDLDRSIRKLEERRSSLSEFDLKKLSEATNEANKRLRTFKIVIESDIGKMSNKQIQDKIFNIIGDKVTKDSPVVNMFDVQELLILRKEAERRRILSRNLKIAIGLVIGAGVVAVTGSAIGISAIVQHSKNSKRTETRNGIVDK